MQRVVVLVLVLVTAIAIRAGIAGADATPVGPLPKHPTTTIFATRVLSSPSRFPGGALRAGSSGGSRDPSTRGSCGSSPKQTSARAS